ncbi:MAG TPA: hypothetical protein VGF45_05065 [Polyangia bacterium]
MQFMTEGGFAMWPILLVGLIGFCGGLRFAIAPEPRWLAFTLAMWVTLLTTVAHATLLDVGAVMTALQNEARYPDPILVRSLFAGLKEATRPAALGGTFLSVIALVVSVGVFRKRFWKTPRTYP